MAIMVKDEMEKDIGPPPEKIREAHLVVEDVFFMKLATRAEEDEVDIITTVYITNDGLGDAKNVKITARPMDNSMNMAHHKMDKIVGNIPVQKTSEIEMIVTVPNDANNFVNLLIFEKGKLILRGSGSFSLSGKTNAPRYETESVEGTYNDTDYDGMSDQWEQYYGLDPTDPSDAKEDPDGDGVSNLGEYRSNTPPCEAKKPADKDDEASAFGVGGSNGISIFIGVMVVVIIIIIIVALVVAGSKSSSTKWENNYNYPDNTQPRSAYKFEPVNGYKPAQPQPQQQNQIQTTAKHCMQCGGWLINNACISCGWRVPENIPITKPPEGQVLKNDEL